MPVSVMLEQPLILSSLRLSLARLTERVRRLRSVRAVLERLRLARRGQLAVSLLTPPSVSPRQPPRSRWVTVGGSQERAMSRTKRTFLRLTNCSRGFLISTLPSTRLHPATSSSLGSWYDWFRHNFLQNISTSHFT